jgi:hypothetical protein
MEMRAGIGLIAVGVSLGFQRDRNETHLAVRDAALRDHGVRKVAYRFCTPSKHRHLKAVFMVEMHMHGGHVEMMALMMRMGQPFGQLPRMVVVDIRECRDALARLAALERRMAKAEARQIAQSLGSIVVSALLHECREFRCELVGHADRNPFHRGVSSLSVFARIVAQGRVTF